MRGDDRNIDNSLRNKHTPRTTPSALPPQHDAPRHERCGYQLGRHPGAVATLLFRKLHGLSARFWLKRRKRRSKSCCGIVQLKIKGFPFYDVRSTHGKSCRDFAFQDASAYLNKKMYKKKHKIAAELTVSSEVSGFSSIRSRIR